MAQYHYTGDHPVEIPELALMNIQPGDTVSTPAVINHPDFQLV